MGRKNQRIVVTAVAQLLATTLGVSWGLAMARRVPIDWFPAPWLLDWRVAGVSALLAFFAEWLRYLISARLRKAFPAISWLCLGLGVFAASLMLADPFVDYRGDESFVFGILLVLPLLLAIGPLSRAQAWLGVAGAVAFLATCLSIIVVNGANWRVSAGFFYHEAT